MGARKNAFLLLVEMGHAFIRFGPTAQGELLLCLLTLQLFWPADNQTHTWYPTEMDQGCCWADGKRRPELSFSFRGHGAIPASGLCGAHWLSNHDQLHGAGTDLPVL